LAHNFKHIFESLGIKIPPLPSSIKDVDIGKEYTLIQRKISKLSRSERDSVEYRYKQYIKRLGKTNPVFKKEWERLDE